MYPSSKHRSVSDFLHSEHFCGAGDDIQRSHGGAIWAGPHPHCQQVNFSTVIVIVILGWSIWAGPHPHRQQVNCSTTCPLLIIIPNFSIVVVVLIISGVALHAHYRNRLAVEVRIVVLSQKL